MPFIGGGPAEDKNPSGKQGAPQADRLKKVTQASYLFSAFGASTGRDGPPGRP